MLITYPQPSLDNLGKYYESEDYISHTDGKRSLFEKAYHFIKGTKKISCSWSIHNSPDKGILDIGAGTEIFWRWQKRMVGKQ
jgi:hypothetical protein